jgi:hypothetical protein
VVEATARNGNIESEFPSLQPTQGPPDVWTLRSKSGTSGPTLRLETEYSNISIKVRDKDSPAAEEENAPRKRRGRSI